ncbi:MAG: TlpA disulfide reductase family protein [Planctomycetota bacterium]|nr:TlpA disulfide reductase family protein [Planctomycetota bacterium]
MNRQLKLLLMMGLAGCGAPQSTVTVEHHPDGHGAIAGQVQEDDHRPISNQVQIGDQVPDFEVTLSGKRWKLSALRQESNLTGDGTIVLTFWCSVCHSCRDVEHALEALARKYRGQVGVFALDATAGETADKVNRFAKTHGLTFPVALDPASQTPRIFGTQRTTTTVIIDRHGVLRCCGKFADATHSYADNALRELMAGVEISVTTTPHKG